MEDLVRGLRNLGLRAPSPAQLLEVLDDDDDVRQRLVRALAFGAFETSGAGDGAQDDDAAMESSATAALMGQDLLQEAVTALIDNFVATIARQRETSRREQTILRAAAAEPDSDVAGSMRGLNIGNGNAEASSSKLATVKPKKIKLPPRKALLARQEAALRRIRDEQETARHKYRGYRPRLVFDGDLSDTSTSALEDLMPIVLHSMPLAPKRYAGAVLVARVISEVLPYIGATFVVEDANQDAITVSVSQFSRSFNLTVEEASQQLSVGTVIAIREPLLSIDHQARAGPCSGKSDIGIRIDSPTDLVVLDAELPVVNSLIDRSKMQSDRFKASKNSIPSWLGLRHLLPLPSHEDDGDLRLVNHLLGDNRPGAAWRMLQRGSSMSFPEDSDAAKLEAQILYKLRAWPQAEKAFARSDKAAQLNRNGAIDQVKVANFVTDISELSTAEAASRCALRARQEAKGLTHDDVRSIYFASTTRARLDTAEYIGPLAVRDISGAGRGLVTTRTVEPGELLLTCRAIGSACPEDDESKGSPLVRLNVDSAVISSTTQVRAQTNLIHAIVDRGEELALPVLGLTAGPHRPYSDYVKQLYPLRAVVNLQAKSQPRLNVDAAYVDGVLRFNAFGPAQSPAKSSDSEDVDETSELFKSTMPHPLPAILNHACLPNVTSIFFSDIVTTRALSRLPPGTEIVHQYVRGEELYPIRASQLSKHGFECACGLCQLDRADGSEACTLRARIIQGEARAVYERSRVLMKRVDVSAIGRTSDEPMSHSEGDIDAHRDVLEALRSLVQRIDDTYAPTRGALRPERIPVLLIAIKHAALVEGVASAIEMCISALHSVGAELEPAGNDPAIGVFMDLPKLHMDAAIQMLLFVAVLKANEAQASSEVTDAEQYALATAAAQPWTQAAFYGHQCMIGGGRDVFLDRWDIEDFAPALKLWRGLS